jgi:hypothetical protein
MQLVRACRWACAKLLLLRQEQEALRQEQEAQCYPYPTQPLLRLETRCCGHCR